MSEWLYDFGHRIWLLPTWVKWALAVFLIMSIDAVRMAWGDRRPVGAYFEGMVAEFFYSGIPLLAFGFGIAGGIKAYEKTKSKIVGWTVGLAVFAAIGAVRIFAEDIPGVGWRIQRMQEAHDFAEDLDR